VDALDTPVGRRRKRALKQLGRRQVVLPLADNYISLLVGKSHLDADDGSRCTE
jgi:hypothetical protein